MIIIFIVIFSLLTPFFVTSVFTILSLSFTPIPHTLSRSHTPIPTRTLTLLPSLSTTTNPYFSIICYRSTFNVQPSKHLGNQLWCYSYHNFHNPYFFNIYMNRANAAVMAEDELLCGTCVVYFFPSPTINTTPPQLLLPSFFPKDEIDSHTPLTNTCTHTGQLHPDGLILSTGSAGGILKVWDIRYVIHSF